MSKEQINILVADDHPVICESIAWIISEIPSISKVDTVFNGLDVISKIQSDEYKLLFLDINMPGLSGIEVIEELHRLQIEISVVIISMYSDSSHIFRMSTLGIKGYILKNTSYEELSKAIELVIEGNEYYSPQVTEMIQNLAPSSTSNEISITAKEQEVLNLICKQLSAKEIADELGISEKTVKRHKQNLLEKTGAKNQVGLAMFAIQNKVNSPLEF